MLAAQEGIEIRIQKADTACIAEHLNECESLFVPALSSRVCVAEYARKLYEKASTIEAWSQDRLVGLVAAYLDELNATAFVSNVSVLKDFQSAGLGSKLMQAFHSAAYRSLCTFVELEVSAENLAAIKFYERLGYTRTIREGQSIRMVRFLGKQL